ncbi:MAG: TonB-dependent receptor, partial [Leadbetterella sp.]
MIRLLLLFTFSISLVFGQKSRAVSGVVYDEKSHENLEGVIVRVGKNEFQTNGQGFFLARVSSNDTVMLILYDGYDSQVVPVSSKKDFEIGLLASSRIGKSERISENKNLKKLIIDKEILKKRPLQLGETDLVKNLSLYSSMSNNEQNLSELSFRGSNLDQSLILLDDVPMYSFYHLNGMQSIFNTETIKSVDVQKGAFSSKFGGRTSSVIDIAMKEGNKKSWHGAYNVGLINQNILLEGPITKSISLLTGLRFSNLGLSHLFSKIESKNYPRGDNVNYFMYDFTNKLNFEFSKRLNMSLNYNSSYDLIDLKNNEFNTNFNDFRERNKWGYNTISARLNYLIRKNITLKAIAYSTKFQNKNSIVASFESPQNEMSFSNTSSIKDHTFKTELGTLSRLIGAITFGAEFTNHTYKPEFIEFVSVENDFNLDNKKYQALELAQFIDVNRDFSNINLNLGLRNVRYSSGNKTYYRLEPRFVVGYNARKFDALISLTRMNQFSSSIQNPNNLSEIIWIPSTDILAPQKADQISLSLRNRFKWFTWDVEFYYKNIGNLNQYNLNRDSFGPGLETLETRLTKNGKGRAKGIENMLSINVPNNAKAIV